MSSIISILSYILSVYYQHNQYITSIYIIYYQYLSVSVQYQYSVIVMSTPCQTMFLDVFRTIDCVVPYEFNGRHKKFSMGCQGIPDAWQSQTVLVISCDGIETVHFSKVQHESRSWINVCGPLAFLPFRCFSGSAQKTRKDSCRCGGPSFVYTKSFQLFRAV